MPNPLYGSPTRASQPPAKLVDNQPAATVAKALSNSKAQVSKAK
jgi:hypothetical protein